MLAAEVEEFDFENMSRSDLIHFLKVMSKRVIQLWNNACVVKQSNPPKTSIKDYSECGGGRGRYGAGYISRSDCTNPYPHNEMDRHVESAQFKREAVRRKRQRIFEEAFPTLQARGGYLGKFHLIF